jgi:hypothetical protein
MTDRSLGREPAMAANVTTAPASPQSVAGRLGAASGIASRALAALASRWAAFVASGQLGPDREREIGRHTGARI